MCAHICVSLLPVVKERKKNCQEEHERTLSLINSLEF